MSNGSGSSRSLPAFTARRLRRSRTADEIAGARLRDDDATVLHDLVRSVRVALGESAPYELVVTPGIGVVVEGSKRRSRALAIGFPLIVQAERIELLTLVAGAITDDRAARRRIVRLAFDWLLEQNPSSVLGPEGAAETLIRQDLCTHLLRDEFWPSIWGEAETRPEAPDDVFERMAAFLLELPEARPADGPLLPAGTLARVAAQLSAEWRAEVGERWRKAHLLLTPDELAA